MNKPIVSSTTSIKIEKEETYIVAELSGDNCFLSIDNLKRVKLNREELKLFAESILFELNKSNGFGEVLTRGIGENAEQKGA